MGGKVQIVVSLPAILIRGLTVNYDRAPVQAMAGLPYNNQAVARCPLELWNGSGKTGVVEEVTLPILWPHRTFSTDEGRQMQAEIGYGWPVELAALGAEENEPEKIRGALHDVGIWYIIALRQSDEELWRHDMGYFRSVCLGLGPDGLGFRLGCASRVWFVSGALVGIPQVSK